MTKKFSSALLKPEGSLDDIVEEMLSKFQKGFALLAIQLHVGSRNESWLNPKIISLLADYDCRVREPTAVLQSLRNNGGSDSAINFWAKLVEMEAFDFQLETGIRDIQAVEAELRNFEKKIEVWQ